MGYTFRDTPPLAASRSTSFQRTLGRVDPRKLGSLHKNLQEKLTAHYRSTREAYRAFQEQNSGTIDFQEFSTFLRRRFDMQGCGVQYMEALFALADENNDGKIDYQEFCRWIKEPDRHENLMVAREDPYRGQRGGLTFGDRCDWIKMRTHTLCE